MAQTAFDISSIPGVTLDQIVKGLETEEQAFADQVCTIISRKSSLSGNIPLDESVFTLSRIANKGLAPLEEASPHGGRMGTFAYNALAYVGFRRVSDEELIARDYFTNAEDLGGAVGMAKREANLNVDARLADVLASTTLNNEYDATVDGTGAWSGAGNPLADLNAITRTYAPNADTMILGRQVYDALVGNSDIIANSSLFDSGQINYDALISLLRTKVRGLRQVYVFDKMYNASPLDGATSTPPGAANVSFARLFETGVWVGHKSALIMVRPTHERQDSIDSERVARTRSYDISYNRYIDICRPLIEMGCVVTNVV